jgi:F0F1-type ATP synthase membrane subunit b/b'
MSGGRFTYLYKINKEEFVMKKVKLIASIVVLGISLATSVWAQQSPAPSSAEIKREAELQKKAAEAKQKWAKAEEKVKKIEQELTKAKQEADRARQEAERTQQQREAVRQPTAK